MRGLIAIIPLFFLFLIQTPSAHAATKYWIGAGSGALSTNGNWTTTFGSACSTNANTTAPTSADTIIFTSFCTANARVDQSLTVTSMKMGINYTGTVTMGNSLTSSSTFTQSGGVVIQNGNTLSVAAGANFFGGTFTAGTGTLALTGGTATVNFGSTLTVNNLTVNATATKTITNSTNVIVNGVLTLTDGTVNQTTILTAGTIVANGNISQASTFDGGSAGLLPLGGSSDGPIQ